MKGIVKTMEELEAMEKDKIAFSKKAWDDYLYWQSQDKKSLHRIDLSGFWSRRIDDSHRLVYRIVGEFIEILSCRDHY